MYSIIKCYLRHILAVCVVSLCVMTGTAASSVKYGAQNETYIEGWEKKTSNLLIYKRLCNV